MGPPQMKSHVHAVLAVLSLNSILDAQNQRPQTQQSQEATQQQASTGAKKHGVNELDRLKGRSCFDVQPGELLGDLVPMGEVTREERRRYEDTWKTALAPAAYPQSPESVEWCKYLWSKVEWAPMPKNAKQSVPPGYDLIYASWTTNDAKFFAMGDSFGCSLTVNFELRGDEMLSIKVPTLLEHPQANVVVVDQLDKPHLFNILTSLFRFPWESGDAFVVEWSPNARPDPRARLKICPANRCKEYVNQQWYQEVFFTFEQGDPQKFTISVNGLRTQAGE